MSIKSNEDGGQTTSVNHTGRVQPASGNGNAPASGYLAEYGQAERAPRTWHLQDTWRLSKVPSSGRLEMIDLLRQRILNGTYVVPTEKLAELLLKKWKNL